MYLLILSQGEYNMELGLFDTIEAGREFAAKLPGYRCEIEEGEFEFLWRIDKSFFGVFISAFGLPKRNTLVVIVLFIIQPVFYFQIIHFPVVIMPEARIREKRLVLSLLLRWECFVPIPKITFIIFASAHTPAHRKLRKGRVFYPLRWHKFDIFFHF